MKPIKLLAVLTFASLASFALTAHAQVFYQYPEARVIPDGRYAWGPYVTVGDDVYGVGGFGRVFMPICWH